ncbi:type I polyketide synthase [Luteitalea sp.]|uniref:type I polyketide synthase n=1 Tax=Luteitalea sp. TaxID=2004800 RepID=UPI0025B8FA98|nr:type I polyketide synthase [Luteitalea sp.]
MSEPRDLSGSEIAIVGMAGRFPDARTLTEFWRNLEGGVESIRVLDEAQLRAAGATEAQLADPRYVRAAAILDDMEWWDAPFWGFTPLDASIMDPQHRLFLECAWEAFEDAGHAPQAFGGAIGVFAGCGMQAYLAQNLLPNRKLMDGTGFFLVRHTGNDKDFLATRVSYQMNLRGPSVSVQTACSTSLVAIHYASQSLLSGECDMALAGGVTIELPHRLGYTYKENEILSPDGHCRPFDADSKGTVFGSGAGVVVLRRLSDAIRDGDRIHAIIRGSAINNDGSRKVSYLAPSVDGQAASIVEALAVAGASPDSISYVETHGTGTPVGDPIEVAALTQAFRTGTDKNAFCGIGSLKSNIGHLDTAAGVASLIKTVLAMQHRKLPPSLHFRSPNPAIDFAASPFYVNASVKEWKSLGPRRAGVSSLGVGGTNAHVILEEAIERPASGTSRPWQLLTVSARTKSALDTASANLADHLNAHPEVPLADAAFTLSVGRQGLKERRIVAARSAEEARQLLDTHAKERVFSDTVAENASVAFMFAGGGAQFAAMGADLHASEPAYREALDECLAHLEPATASRVRALLLPAAGQEAEGSTTLEQPSLALPALFSTQYAMAKLLESWGIVPAAMIGHSMGEYTAAHLAGVFSLRDAVRLVALRGRLFEKVPPGAMLSVPLSEDELAPLLGGDLSLAAVNAPQLSLASGPIAAIEALQQTLAAREIDAKRLHIAVAAHSAMLEPILGEFGAFFRTIEMHAPVRRFVSNESGTWITAEQATDANYWVRHLRNTVRFADGVRELVRDPQLVLLEVGPGRVLATLARQHPDRQASQLVMTSMRSAGDEDGDQGVALTALGRLWARGVRPDWRAFWADEKRLRVGLPTYPWERQRHWIDAPVATTSAVPDDARRSRVEDWFARPSWRQTLPPAPLARLEERVLVFVDALGFAENVARRLEATGCRVFRVSVGTTWTRDGDRFTVRPEAGADHTQLLAALVADGGLPDRIVHAWGITDAAQPAALDVVTNLGFHSLLGFAQALNNEEPDAAITVNVLTTNLQRIGGELVLEPAKALALGPARVMPREFPNVRSRAIDLVLPATESKLNALAALVAAEVTSEPVDENVAFRGPDRYVHELVPVRLDPVHDRLRHGGAYLITGGMGGIGYTLAAHLASTCKARLVLVGRGATPARAKARKEALEALGAEVEVVQADVTNHEQMTAVVARAKARFGVLSGVFHAAGTLGDSLMPLKTRDDAERVLGPKVRGTLALDAAIGEAPLDLFVLFSSVSALAGLAGQADYAAANAFLDAFAQERSARTGQFTVAVGWSAWRDVGMATQLATGANAGDGVGEEVHPVLGRRVSASRDAEVFSAELSVDAQWVLAEHRLRGGRSLLPGTAYLEIARAAVQARPEGRTLEMSDIAFMSPFVVEDHAPREMRVHLTRGEGRQTLVIAGRTTTDDGSTAWQEHVTATVGYCDEQAPAPLDLAALSARCNVREAFFTGEEENAHLDFGRRWKNLKSIRYGEKEALARLELAEEFVDDLEAFHLHPALMDMATACAEALAPGFNAASDFYVPLSYTRLRMYAPLSARIRSHVRLVPSDFDPKEIVVFDVTISDETGKVLVDITEFLMTRVADTAQLQGAGSRTAMRRTHANFEPAPTPSHAPPLVQGLDEAITSEEGMRALDRIIGGPAISQVFATPKDVRALLVELRNAQAPRPAVRQALTALPTVPLADIEAALATHEAVGRCVVMQRLNRPGELKLVAYVVFAPGESATVSDMRRFLKAKLSEHLVPSNFVDLDELPTRSDGTVDRSALPDPFGAADDFVAPRTETESIVAEIWKEVLGVPRVSVYDNFFDIGGHSLLAVRIVTRLDKKIGVRLNQAVMVLQTLEQIAAECDKRRGGPDGAVAPSSTTSPSPSPAPSSQGLGQKLFNALRRR